MAKKEDTEIAVREDMEVAGIPDELAGIFSPKESMEGVEIRLPQIKILHQGKSFEMADGETVREFQGVILDVNNVNAYWKVSFQESGGGTPPQCMSTNGARPDPMAEEMQSELCKPCKQNQFGSDGGRGKACKNMKRIHVLLEGQHFPNRLTVPPTSMKFVDQYLSLLLNKGTPYELVVTKFSLKDASNKEGIKYSQLKLENVGLATKDPAEAREIKKLKTEMLPMMRDTVMDDVQAVMTDHKNGNGYGDDSPF